MNYHALGCELTSWGEVIHDQRRHASGQLLEQAHIEDRGGTCLADS